jgi:dihydroorotase-like cyclic amidohydrolase
MSAAAPADSVSAPLDLVLRSCRLPDGRATDIGCRDGRIALISSLAGQPAGAVVQCGGRAVTPMGSADLALMGFLAAVGCHMGTPRELADVLNMLTRYPARILRLADYGLDVGCRADLVVWEAESALDTVATIAPRWLVVKNGRISVEHERVVRARWRASQGCP